MIYTKQYQETKQVEVFTLSFFYGRRNSNIISLFVIQQNDISIEKNVNRCHLLEVSPSSGLDPNQLIITCEFMHKKQQQWTQCHALINEHVQIFTVIIAM